MAQCELAVDCAADLGESPIWCGRSRTLAFVDINKKKVFEYNPRDGSTLSVDVGKLVGCVVPRASGGLLACLEDSIVPVVINITIIFPIF